MIIRIALLFFLLHMINIMQVEVCHREGLLLCKLNNLPHRALGMLYYAQMKYPGRGDYVRDYLVEYYKKTVPGEEWLIEGQKKPVVSMFACVKAAEFPRNKDIQLIRKVIMHNQWIMAEKESNPSP